MKPIIYYFYDAHCGWCYGFSDVIKKAFSMYNNIFQFKVISGELIDRNLSQHIGHKAEYILQAYPRVQNHTGKQFSETYIQLLQNHQHTDVECNSTMPAKALAIFKEFYPNTAINFAGLIQEAHYVDGKSLAKKETYVGIAEKYRIPMEDFHAHWDAEEDAHHHIGIADMDFCKLHGVNGYPAIGLQTEDDGQIQILQHGYTSYEQLSQLLDEVQTKLKL
jgi:putative protein-disulfide isomerase